MTWSKQNMEAMGQLIILRDSGALDELFYGNWRETYEKYHELDTKGWYMKSHPEYVPPQGKLCSNIKI